MFSQLAGGGARWCWDFANGNGPKGFQAHRAAAFEAAKTNVERNWPDRRLRRVGRVSVNKDLVRLLLVIVLFVITYTGFFASQ